MTYQHQTLAKGRWKTLSLSEQLANIGSEVERTISWKKKGNKDYSRMAFYRALELIDITLTCPITPGGLREIARVREGLVDWFMGENIYKSTNSVWQNYFMNFTIAARR
jgi:hypothetical protein